MCTLSGVLTTATHCLYNVMAAFVCLCLWQLLIYILLIRDSNLSNCMRSGGEPNFFFFFFQWKSAKQTNKTTTKKRFKIHLCELHRVCVKFYSHLLIIILLMLVFVGISLAISVSVSTSWMCVCVALFQHLYLTYSRFSKTYSQRIRHTRHAEAYVARNFSRIFFFTA